MAETSSTTIRTEVYADFGPVWKAISTLLAGSTLADHVHTDLSETTVVRVYHDPDGLPFEVWGSGTQALWRLLLAIAYTGETVSLYEVVSRLDTRNRRAVALAIAELCS